MHIWLIFGLLFTFSFIHADKQPVVLITGGSRGVGLETAKCFAKSGFIVYATVRNLPEKNEKNVQFIELDLLDTTSIEKTVQHIVDRHGRIDVLINNAGYALVGPLELLTEEQIHDQMEVNFFAPIRCIKAVLPTMREQKSGRIINISSTNAFGTPPFGGLYAASKSALESLSESLRIEVEPYHIFVSIVEPGLLQTQFGLTLGMRHVSDHSYDATMKVISSEIEERRAHPEKLSPSQTPQEIGAFLLSIAQESHPKLRYQTSEEASREVSKKLLDLSGDLYLEEVRKWQAEK